MRLRSILVSIMTILGIAVSVPQANAALSDDWAFAFNNHLTPIGGFTLMDPTHQWSKYGGANGQVRSPSTGRYEVLFPKTGAKRGIVHVTSAGLRPGWCQVANGWKTGSDGLHVFIDCYAHNGTRANSQFSVVFTESSGPIPVPPGAHDYVFADFQGTIVNEFNSSGAANFVGWGGAGSGLYKVFLPGAGPKDPSGNLQVTAVGLKPARCKVAEWYPSASGQTVVVACFDAGSKPYDTAWTLSYNRQRPVFGEYGPPKRFGHILVTPALPALTNFNSGGAVNTVSFGPGQYLVTFPKIGLKEDHVQVTAYGPGPDYCVLSNLWFTSTSDGLVRNVECYNAAGSLAKNDSFVAYTSRQ